MIKNINLLILTVLVFNSTQYSQTLIDYNNLNVSNGSDLYPIPGSHLLYQKEEVIREYIKQNPNYSRLNKSSSAMWNFSVGDYHEWWATNLETYNEYLVSSTCRAIGNHCYIFVEDNLWNNRVTQDGVDSIKEAFENSTPANSNKGIYLTDVESFGEPPDVDSDPRIIILILDIKDGFSGSGGYVAGYFYSINEYEDGDPAISGSRSNHTEIYYVDANPADLTTTSGLNNALATAAHEFQHMIHWNWDDFEEVFINEGCSMIAEHICGYNLGNWFNLYQEDTNRNLFTWDYEDVFPDYARAALWTLYLLEQFPNGFLEELVQNQLTGIDGLNSTLLNHIPNLPVPPGRLFESVFTDWLIANYANDASLNRKYFYQYYPLNKPTPIHIHSGSSDVSPITETINPLAAHYIKFEGGSNLSMEFNSNGEFLKIKAIKIGSTVVEDVPKNTTYTPVGYGDTFSEVTFLVYNNSPSQNASYTYSAIGPEISYDDGVPEGYIQTLAEGDSVAVQFDGKPNTKLDSIKIAFRYPGIIKMDINEYNGQSYFRGKKLHKTIEVVSPKSSSSEPYVAPFDNWVTTTIFDKAVITSDDFVISFLIGEKQSDPAIMYSSERDLGKGSQKSYFYSNDYKTKGWDILIDELNRGNVKNLLVRAYISANTSLIIDQDEGKSLSRPSIFLEQNFPNPFNSSTTIQYEIDKESKVSTVIYDLQGNKVKTIVDTRKSPGRHSTKWDGSNENGIIVSNGIYLYTLTIDNFVQTRKMLYLK